MGTGSTSILRRALAATGLWHEATSLHELAGLVVTSLHDLVPADGVGWNEVDVTAHRTHVLTSPTDYLQPKLATVLDRLVDQHPIVAYVARTGDERAVKISDLVSAREYRRLEIYSEFFRPVGIEDQLAMIAQAEPVIIGIAFTRDRRSFLERERWLLNLLRPHVSAAYRRLVERADAAERIDALERGLEGRAVVRLEQDGSLAERSAVLERWFGPLVVPASGVYENASGRLDVRRVEGDPPLLLLDEARYAPDPARTRELGLTRRETEVLGLVARGLTDAEIARALYVSPRTVSKHLQNAYEKLGVRDRAAAVRVLLG